MSNQWATPNYIDGDFTVSDLRAAIGIPEKESPIPATTKEYLFTQEFMQALASFYETPLNTVHPSSGLTPDYSGFFVVKEFDKRDLGGGIIKFKRMYGAKPDSHDEFETYAYNFIGFVGKIWTSVGGSPGVVGSAVDSTGTTTLYSTPFSGGTGWSFGRPRYSPPGGVDCRVSHDYFIIGPSLNAWSSSGVYTAGQQVNYSGTTSYYRCIASVGPTATTPDADPTHWALIGVYATPDYSSPGSIPVINPLTYQNTDLTAFNLGVFTDFLLDAVGSLTASLPSRADYTRWITNAQTYGFGGDVIKVWHGPWSSSQAYVLNDQVSYVNSGTLAHYECISPVGPSATNPFADTSHWSAKNLCQLTPEASRLSRWQGNIWLRQTRYILAQ